MPNKNKRVSHAELLAARDRLGKPKRGDPLHQRLAALEHGAFAREFAEERPFAAAVSMPFAIPGYAAGKAVGQGASGFLESRRKMGRLGQLMTSPLAALARPIANIDYFQGTRPSVDQMAESYRGLRRGLRSAIGLDKPEIAPKFMREGREVLASHKPRKKNLKRSNENLSMNSKTISHMGGDW